MIQAHYVSRGKYVHVRLFMASGLIGTLTLSLLEFDAVRAEYPEWDWTDADVREAA